MNASDVVFEGFGERRDFSVEIHKNGRAFIDVDYMEADDIPALIGLLSDAYRAWFASQLVPEVRAAWEVQQKAARLNE